MQKAYRDLFHSVCAKPGAKLVGEDWRKGESMATERLCGGFPHEGFLWEILGLIRSAAEFFHR
jgi:hypothetical protein